MSMTGDRIGKLTGQHLGLDGKQRRVTCRLLHVLELRDGNLSNETPWPGIGVIRARGT
jgi:hypothetical protein